MDPIHLDAQAMLRDWKSYQYTAQCVPSDVCAVDVVGATKGLKGKVGGKLGWPRVEMMHPTLVLVPEIQEKAGLGWVNEYIILDAAIAYALHRLLWILKNKS